MFPRFTFMFLSAFFCLSFSSLPLRFDILTPKSLRQFSLKTPMPEREKNAKTEKNRMHRRADFWSNLWEVLGALKQTSKKLPRKSVPSAAFHIMATSQKLGGNFWEVEGQLLQITAKTETFFGCNFLLTIGRKSRVRLSQASALEDPNLLNWRSLGSSCPFFPSDNRIWGQWALKF